MKTLFKGGQVYSAGHIFAADVRVEDDKIIAVGEALPAEGAMVVDATGCLLAPGFVDMHVHLREPGYPHKETVETGTQAAAAGGFTTVCAMPNLAPVPDCPENLAPQLEAVRQGAVVEVLPYGALTRGEKGCEPADVAGLASAVCGFTDDGFGVQDDAVMKTVMAAAAKAGRLVAAHCEVEALLPKNGVCVQENSTFALKHGFCGHSLQSEWQEVERDVAICAATGCQLHICHASAEGTYNAVRAAKQRGLPVSCEVTPHNLLLSCDDILDDDGRFKMNPPLRTPQDVQAAVQALCDGTAEVVATDHAPHTAEDKSGGFAKSLNGVVGLETAFAALYTGLVANGKVPLPVLLAALCDNPRRLLALPPVQIAPGFPATLTLLDLETERMVDPQRFKSKGRSTPFVGRVLRGWPVKTLYKGEKVFDS